jgi:hypothetical protein
MTDSEARGYVMCLRQLRRMLRESRQRFMALTPRDVEQWAQDRIEAVENVYGFRKTGKEG